MDDFTDFLHGVDHLPVIRHFVSRFAMKDFGDHLEDEFGVSFQNYW